MNLIINLWKKYKDIIVYAFFGGITTLVNYAVYLPCLNLFHMSAAVSNVIAFCVAVTVAYLTNKSYVFHSHDWSLSTLIPEFSKFIGSRLFSGALETGILFVLCDLLHFNGNIVKLAVSVLTIVLNYITSKFLVFQKKE